jgi:quercetin dioxygenase-like cupin family protein
VVTGSGRYSRRMKVVRAGEVPREELAAPLFTGLVTMQMAIGQPESQINVGYVHFPAGVRNKMHRHTTDQILIVTSGKGRVVTETEQVELSEGDVVHAPAGEKHWHGASDDSAMTHIAITPAGSELEQLED